MAPRLREHKHICKNMGENEHFREDKNFPRKVSQKLIFRKIFRENENLSRKPSHEQKIFAKIFVKLKFSRKLL
jgi:hypothetical protein